MPASPRPTIHRHRVAIDRSSTRTVRVWLPAETPLGVLYLLDGQNILATSRRATWAADRTCAALIATGAIGPIALVAIDAGRGARRWEEYLPYPDPRNARARRYRADVFADEILPRVMREVGRHHRGIARAAHVGIGGSSYGAIAALHSAIRHPRIFDRILIESAPLWVGDGRLIDEAAGARPTARVWIGVGTRESSRPERSAELVRLHRRLARAMRHPEGAVRLRVVEDGVHHESAWGARLPEALRWLFASAPRH